MGRTSDTDERKQQNFRRVRTVSQEALLFAVTINKPWFSFFDTSAATRRLIWVHTSGTPTARSFMSITSPSDLRGGPHKLATIDSQQLWEQIEPRCWRNGPYDISTQAEHSRAFWAYWPCLSSDLGRTGRLWSTDLSRVVWKWALWRRAHNNASGEPSDFTLSVLDAHRLACSSTLRPIAEAAQFRTVQTSIFKWLL